MTEENPKTRPEVLTMRDVVEVFGWEQSRRSRQKAARWLELLGALRRSGRCVFTTRRIILDKIPELWPRL